VDLAFQPENRRNYAGFIDGWNKLATESNGLWKGLSANLWRAVLLNATISYPYNDINERMWITFGDTVANRPIALLFGALTATFITLPFDNLKTRL